MIRGSDRHRIDIFATDQFPKIAHRDTITVAVLCVDQLFRAQPIFRRNVCLSKGLSPMSLKGTVPNAGPNAASKRVALGCVPVW